MNGEDFFLVRRRLGQLMRAAPTTLALGTGAGQVILLLLAPLLSRLYTPAAFGVFASAAAVCALIGPIATLKLESVVALEANEKYVGAATRLALLAVATCSSLVGILLCLLTWLGASRTGISMQWEWGLAVPPTVMVAGVWLVLVQTALRRRNYNLIASSGVLQCFGTGASQLALSLVTRTGGGLLWGSVLGRSIGIVALARVDSRWLRRPHAGTYPALLRRYRSFPLVFAPSAVLNALGLQLPLLLILLWFGPYEAGLLALTQRVIMTPSMVLIPAFGQWFAAEVAARLRASSGTTLDFYLRVSAYLSIPAAFVVGASWFVAPILLPPLMGPGWDAVGDYARAVGVATALGLVVAPTSYVLIAHERAARVVAIDISRVALILSFGLLAHARDATPVVCVASMYGGLCVTYVGMWFVGRSVSSREKVRRLV